MTNNMDNIIIDYAIEFLEEVNVKYSRLDNEENVELSYDMNTESGNYSIKIIVESAQFCIKGFSKYTITESVEYKLLSILFDINYHNQYATILYDINNKHIGCRIGAFFNNNMSKELFMQYINDLHGTLDFYTERIMSDLYEEQSN